MIENETLKTIKRRRSIRSYYDEQISEDELQAIVEAGQYAPNAGGQVWHFTVVQDRGLLDRLNRAAKQGAQGLENEFLQGLGRDEHFDCLYGAPTLMLVSGMEQAPVPLEADCAAATQNMLLAAESLGLGSCWIYFVLFAFSTPQAPELLQALQIPAGYRPYDAAVFGHARGEVTQPPPRKPDLVTIIR